MSILAQKATFAAGEVAKVPAFIRRDLLVALSYRTAFVGDVVGLGTQVVLFYFVGQMVEAGSVPSYAGTQASYLEFVAIGIAVGVFVQVGLMQVSVALRNEQLMGTLESIFVTPTSTTTIQLGSVAYDLVYVPIRTGVFLVITALAFGLDFHASGLLPSVVMLLLFVPFIWGLGLIGAAAVLTFRRGGGVTAVFGIVLTLGSGAYFPLDLLPSWAEQLAEWNPIAITVDAMRLALIGGEGWSALGTDALIVAGAAAVSMLVGLTCFRISLRYERVRGTLGLY
ncbi:MAG TPA: ABC transporter permease [Gaiellaceae bacterium]|nr:ABC transporter permease [Gaiellaceae bacterium]